MLRYLCSWSKERNILFCIASLIILLLIIVAAGFVYNAYFRHYTLLVTGGEKISNRHQLARILQEEAAKENVDLIIKPTSGSFSALDKVNKGELDLAFVQGGLTENYENVALVKNLMTEMLHLVVKPDIRSIEDLRGKTINMGTDNGGTHIVATKVLEFFGLKENVDYRESYNAVEELSTINGSLLAEAMFILSTLPSSTVEDLVEKQGYRILPLPSINALMAKYSWQIKGVIAAASYGKSPPVPEHNVETVGVELQLVCNNKVNKTALKKLLKVLDSPQLQKKMQDTMRSDEFTENS